VPSDEGTAVAVADADVAGADVAGADVAGADVAGVELELEELELELQAATPPTTRTVAMATSRHPEPALIRCRIPVKRIITPFRLSAVDSPVAGFPVARGAAPSGVRN
jgi:hypothetical protein